MLPLAAVQTQTLPLLCQTQPAAGHPGGFPGRRVLSQGWGMPGTARGRWPHKIPVRYGSKTEGESSSKGWSVPHTVFPTPSGGFFASFVCTCLYLSIPCKWGYCPWYLTNAGHVMERNHSTDLALKSTLGGSLPSTLPRLLSQAPYSVFIEGLSDHSQQGAANKPRKSHQTGAPPSLQGRYKVDRSGSSYIWW